MYIIIKNPVILLDPAGICWGYLGNTILTFDVFLYLHVFNSVIPRYVGILEF